MMNKRSYNTSKQENLKKAVEAVKEGCSFYDAARQFDVKRTTFSDKLKNQIQKLGRLIQVSYETEVILAKMIDAVAKWGYPLGEIDIKEMVKSLLDSKGVVSSIFPNNRPGEK